MRSEGEPHDVCDGVQVGAARGAWGCRKVSWNTTVRRCWVTFLWMDAFFLKSASSRCQCSRAWAWCQIRACLPSEVSLWEWRMDVEVDEKRDKGIHASVGFVPSCFNDVA